MTKPTVRSLHDEAMVYAQDAHIAANPEEAKSLFALALPFELQAIEVLEQAAGTGPDTEPTRSILYLGAASLAWRSGDNIEAKRLADIGLAGSPTPRTRADLLELLEAIAA